MKKWMCLFILFAFQLAHADMITCFFSEPFFKTIYDTNTRTLTYLSLDTQPNQTIHNVSFEFIGTNVFELVSESGNVLQTLTLHYKGNDGMSDALYPFEVKDSKKISDIQDSYGGCISSHLKKRE